MNSGPVLGGHRIYFGCNLVSQQCCQWVQNPRIDSRKHGSSPYPSVKWSVPGITGSVQLRLNLVCMCSGSVQRFFVTMQGSCPRTAPDQVLQIQRRQKRQRMTRACFLIRRRLRNSGPQSANRRARSPILCDEELHDLAEPHIRLKSASTRCGIIQSYSSFYSAMLSAPCFIPPYCYPLAPRSPGKSSLELWVVWIRTMLEVLHLDLGL